MSQQNPSFWSWRKKNVAPRDIIKTNSNKSSPNGHVTSPVPLYDNLEISPDF